MPSEPLSPRDVDALLRPDMRTVAADLYALSDNLDRMRNALASLNRALADLDAARRRVHKTLPDAEAPRPPAQRGD